jgi:septal ring factor EnvC (AmiA/AmiB activator)
VVRKDTPGYFERRKNTKLMMRDDPDRQRLKTIKDNIKSLKKERNDVAKRNHKLEADIRRQKREAFEIKMGCNNKRKNLMKQQKNQQNQQLNQQQGQQNQQKNIYQQRPQNNRNVLKKVNLRGNKRK